MSFNFGDSAKNSYENHDFRSLVPEKSISVNVALNDNYNLAGLPIQSFARFFSKFLIFGRQRDHF